MKTKEQLEKVQVRMISQISELMEKVGEADTEEEGLMMITNFLGKLSMVNFILDDTNAPFKAVEEATTYAFKKTINHVIQEDLAKLLV